MKYIIINIFKYLIFVLKYCDLVELNVNIFVVDHKVLSKCSTTFSIYVPTCDVSTKICIIITFYTYSYDY